MILLTFLLIQAKKISVKTITEWSAHGKGTQVKPLKEVDNPWNTLAIIQLDKELKPKMLSIIPIADLLKQEEIKKNVHRRANGTNSHPIVNKKLVMAN
jgi:hypothetical protein